MSDIDATLRYLEGLTALGIRPGLEGIEATLARLGNPERAAPMVRVGGTNGKGSTATLVAGALAASGRHTGLFTSPHLLDVRERIRLDGRILAPAPFVRAMGEVRRAIDESPSIRLTYFEAICAAAFVAFREAGTQVNVVEVGLGGRWDATNVGDATVAVVTNVEMDHMQHLGRSKASIAAEKVRIATPGGILVTGVRSGPAAEVIRKYARQHRIRVRHPPVVPIRGPRLRYRGSVHELDVPEPGLGGGFQHRNAALAIATLEELEGLGLGVSTAQIHDTLTRARWPGRLHRVAERPALVVDGAHNAHAAAALASSLDVLLPERPRVLLLAQLARKSPRGFLRPLAARVDHIITTTLPDHECVPADTLADLAAQFGVRAEAVCDPELALARARKRAGREGGICVTGSLYLVSRWLEPADVEFLAVDIDPVGTESKGAGPSGSRHRARAERRSSPS